MRPDEGACGTDVLAEAGIRPALAIEGLNVTYKSSRGSLTALRDIDLTLGTGEFLSILGPSGCGKSTLLKVVAGLLRPSSGEVRLNGTRIEGPSPEVGIVFQQPTLLPWLNVLENVLLPVRTHKGDLTAGRVRAMELLRLVRLEGFARHYPGELSGGMQQRVAIARGLVQEPALLLMDEPLAALDAMTREHMMIELQRIWERTRCSVVYITHSIPEAVFLSDRIVVLSAHPGRVSRELRCDLERPRTLDTMGEPHFIELCHTLRVLFRKPDDQGEGP